jgi:hypothetical protein
VELRPGCRCIAEVPRVVSRVSAGSCSLSETLRAVEIA